MATYAIGDIQGCYDELQNLLKYIQFDSVHDRLWLTGDLVCRGRQSLQVLRFIKSLDNSAITVLGNHDLHLIALAYGVGKLSTDNASLSNILNAPDREELITWLRHQPLLHHDAQLGYTLVHAGIAPQWDLTQAMHYAQEVTHCLQYHHSDFLPHLYGNQPNAWQNTLTGHERIRCLINYFTRMRFCNSKGHLNLTYNSTPADAPNYLTPWFAMPNRKMSQHTILFGHWAALQGKTSIDNIHALDTGCVWGGKLRALRLEDKKSFQVNCINNHE
ncbi:MAG: symmetrical bis(5'-nucleosyl)-tetraphosphatase [Gammaproteobacteria bacterium]|nr:symmetrical bis(5'-nucleosyl)-tetraphosphatase [Gammaproteobacteria bacterium]